MKTALITGASGGIGKELALIFAKNGHIPVIVARNIDKLDQLSAEIEEKFKISALALKFDLSQPGAAQKLFDELKERKIQIDFLVNNAGFGDFGKFSIEKMDKYTNMINLNITTLTELTTLFADDMKKRGFGKIMNVASTASFQPLPYFSVYSATKAYVLSLTEALYFEFKGSGVSFSALCPGPTNTNFSRAADMEKTPLFDEKGDGGMAAKEVAEIGYEGMMKGKMTIVTGFKNKINAYFSGKMPNRKIIPSMMAKNFEKNIGE
ncbi:MAG: SDR family oxidoreductase [Bacteroidales bacterium]|nr:SDR family oxidoreductase [Bacteroidales bacterium]